jgi:hypothetical protein
MNFIKSKNELLEDLLQLNILLLEVENKTDRDIIYSMIKNLLYEYGDNEWIKTYMENGITIEDKLEYL